MHVYLQLQTTLIQNTRNDSLQWTFLPMTDKRHNDKRHSSSTNGIQILCQNVANYLTIMLCCVLITENQENLQQMTLKTYTQTNGKVYLNESLINEWSWKHFGKWRNCSLLTISSYATLFSKVVFCLDASKSLHAGKG